MKERDFVDEAINLAMECPSQEVLRSVLSHIAYNGVVIAKGNDDEVEALYDAVERGIADALNEREWEDGPTAPRAN